MPTTARTIALSFAPVLEHLELEQASIVTLDEISRVAREAGIRTPAKIIAHRLARLGWLLPTGVRGVWEFAPADRAGPIGGGDPFLTLRALLATGNDVGATLALGSALWCLDLAERAPDRHEVAVPPGADVPSALRRSYRVVRFAPRLAPIEVRGAPVERPASVLVHLVHRPTDVRSWSVALDQLPALVDGSTLEELARELQDRPHATHVRLAYLTSGVAPKLAKQLAIEPAGKVWFGPRAKLLRHDARWNVADTVLPINPRELEGDR